MTQLAGLLMLPLVSTICVSGRPFFIGLGGWLDITGAFGVAIGIAGPEGLVFMGGAIAGPELLFAIWGGAEGDEGAAVGALYVGAEGDEDAEPALGAITTGATLARGAGGRAAAAGVGVSAW